jgi:hypothetical protein
MVADGSRFKQAVQVVVASAAAVNLQAVLELLIKDLLVEMVMVVLLLMVAVVAVLVQGLQAHRRNRQKVVMV